MSHDAGISHWLRAVLSKHGQAPALILPDGESISYADLEGLLSDLVVKLQSAGVEPAQRVAVLLPAGPRMGVCCMAAMSAAGCVPLNPDYPPLELARRLEATGSDWLLCDSSTVELAAGASESLDIGLLVIDGEGSGWLPATLECRRAPPSTAPDPGVAPEDRAVLWLQTSGSTAEPKVVPLSARNLLHSVRGVRESLKLSASDRCLNMLPMYHVGGLIDLLLAPLSAGGSVIICRDMSTSSFNQALEELYPTWIQAVPAMLQNIVRDCPPELARAAGLRLIRSVSAPLPSRLLQRVERRFDAPVIEMYGMTETAGIICSNPLPPEPRKQGSVGKVFGLDLRVVDRRSRLLPPNQPGDVQVRGDSVFVGYETPNQGEYGEFDQGWFRTGDEGYLDEEGYLYVVGRTKEIINRGGEKIAPLEIDRAAEHYSTVVQAAAYAVPHASLGEDVAMALVVDSPEGFDRDDFLDFMGTRLARFKLPQSIALLDRIPTTRGGKLQRHRLPDLVKRQREEHARGTTKSKPATELEQALAALWCELLELEDVHLEDDFFESGGDSLTAAVMMAEVKTRLGVDIPMASLYRAPTIEKLAKVILERADAPATIQGDILLQVADELGAFMSAWRGEREGPDSLLVGRNVNGTLPPLFWGVNAYSEFDQLADALGPDQPVYGFRSLFRTNFRYEVGPSQLARLYLNELRVIQPSGPYLLGGFCEAGKVAFELAERLMAEGETVASLMLQEQFVAKPYQGRVACFICASGENSPFYPFRHPLRGWRKYYGGPLALYRTRMKHHHVYSAPQVHLLARQIAHELRMAQRQTQAVADQRNHMQVLPHQAYRVALSSTIPARAVPLTRITASVDVTNTSQVTWLPTDRSGIMLAARWSNRRSVIKYLSSGFAPLEDSLEPGATTSVEIQIKVPWRPGRFNLELDMIDDGVRWFNRPGNAPLEHPITISPLPRFELI